MSESSISPVPAGNIKPNHRRSRRRHRKRPTEGDQAQSVPPSANSNRGRKATTVSIDNKSARKSLQDWKQHVPKGSVDPISLEPIRSLPYPPFVLKAAPPYETVTVWPPTASSSINEESQRQKQLLQEQWGQSVVESRTDTANNTANMDDTSDANNCLIYHFFDGKVLAYYLVSQLQFIDPLNRRELTRDEIVQLDIYLKQHKLYTASFASVLEAYDAKTKDSRAGDNNTTNIPATTTSAGRAFLLQQEARGLLEAMFATATSNTNRTQRNNQTTRDTRRNHTHTRLPSTVPSATTHFPPLLPTTAPDRYNLNPTVMDQGVYGGHSEGLVIIDDDLNPGLRGGIITANSTVTTNLNVQNHSQRVRAFHFPQLSPAPYENQQQSFHRSTSSNLDAHSSFATRTLSQRAESYPNLPTPPTSTTSKTLDKITSMISKTNPKEKESQQKAREEWLRKTAMAKNAVFDPTLDTDETAPHALAANIMETSLIQSKGYARSISQDHLPCSESMIERNKVLAEALGVVPATIRGSSNFNSGWTRPTSFLTDTDEFGNELNTITYPDSLIIQARERLDELIKLERKWMLFLKDDSAASISLKPMDKPTRTFVHEYSDYWKLQTQSYDDPPRRYIHCVKTDMTCAPYPQLSTAARHWKGPSKDVTITQSAGQLTRSESYLEMLHLDERAPLQLSKPSVAQNMQETYTTTCAIGQDPTSISNRAGPPPIPVEPAPRFAQLLSERERPKLLLQPRSVVLEEPISIDQKTKTHKPTKEEKSKKDKALKESIIAAAFASDESSDWDVGEELYSGDEDE